jgi:hypothetical protein
MQRNVEIPVVFLKDEILGANDFGLSKTYRDMAVRAIVCQLLEGNEARESLERRAFKEILDLVHSGDHRVIQHALAGYDSWNKGLAAITSYQRQSSPPVDFTQYSLPKEYKRNIKLSLGKQGSDLSSLQDAYERSLRSTGIPQLIKEVLRLAPEGKQADLVAIFDLIKSKLGSPDMGLPPVFAGDLVVLTYLPGPVRYAVSDLIVTETFIRALVAFNTEQDRELIKPFNHISEYLRSQVLCGSRWASLARSSGNQGLQEDIVRLCIEGCEKLKALAELSTDAGEDSPSCKAIKLYYETAKILRSSVLKSSILSTCPGWQTIDIGHAFHGFKDHLFDSYFGSSRLGPRAPGQFGKKGAAYAAILEDDDRQQKSYADFIGRYSAYNLFPERQSLGSSPEELDGVVDDKLVQLFLLDIQNDKNPRAGVELAEKIMRQRVGWSNSGESEPKRHTKIILWSYSEDAIVEARAHLCSIADEIDPQKERIDGLPERGEGADSPIRVSIWHKCAALQLLDQL